MSDETLAEAIVKMALQRAAEKATRKLLVKRLYTQAQSVSDAIRALASDPEAVAQIIKEAERDSGLIARQGDTK